MVYCSIPSFKVPNVLPETSFFDSVFLRAYAKYLLWNYTYMYIIYLNNEKNI